MSDIPQGPDWEKGSDGKWYAPGVLSGAGWWVAADGVWYPGPAPAAQPLPATPAQPPEGRSVWDRIAGLAGAAWAAFRRLPAKAQVIVASAIVILVVMVAAVAALTSRDPEDEAVATTAAATPTTVAELESAEPPDPTTTTGGPSAQIELADRSIGVQDVTIVDVSGQTAPGATVIAEWRDGEAATTAGPQGNFTVTIDGLDTEGAVNVNLSSEAPGGDADEASLTITRTVGENTFKFFTRRIPYDELVRDPDALIGETVNYRARVLQYDSVTSTAAMLVYVTEEDFGFWTDNVLVTLDPSLGSSIDNDDIIDLWGTVTGAETYETAIGGSNTVPTVEARYMTLVEKQ